MSSTGGSRAQPPSGSASCALPCAHRPADGPGAGLLILIHGRGTDEHDLAPLADALDPQRRLHVALPRGPLQLPPGGNHWYVVARVGHPEPRSFARSEALLGAWAPALAAELGVPWSRTVLGGFSQGAVMSYAIALGAGNPAPAGLLTFSGFIPTVQGFTPSGEGHRQMPVAIAHGSEDPIIGVEFGRSARRWLQAEGFDVVYDESPIAHSIDPAVLVARREWLATVLDDVS